MRNIAYRYQIQYLKVWYFIVRNIHYFVGRISRVLVNNDSLIHQAVMELKDVAVSSRRGLNPGNQLNNGRKLCKFTYLTSHEKVE